MDDFEKIGEAMPDDMEPLYVQIYRELLNDIKSGKYDKNQKLPTEKELSEQFFVSRITSKKAMNMLAKENVIIRIKGKGSYVSPHLCENISDEPDTVKRKAIGVIFSDVSESYGQEVFMTIEKCCREHEMLCVFFRSEGDQEIEHQAVEYMIEHGVAGIIIMPVHGAYYNAAVLRLVLDGFPIVVVDRDLRGMPSHFVGTDNVAAAKDAMDFLINAGHRKIGIYSPNMFKTSSLEDRMEGTLQSIEYHNIPITQGLFFTQIYSTMPGNQMPDAFEKDCQVIMEHIQANPGITAALAMEYQIALMIKNAAQRLGLRVPEDISIMCFDSPKKGHKASEKSDFEFTHIRQKEKEIGKGAFDLLMSLIQGELYAEAVKIMLSFSVEAGPSTQLL